jgi:CDP-diglyceride synthetase
MSAILSFIVFILACYGLTQILVFGKIFDIIRPKYYFFHCTMCVGFWVGVLMYFVIGLYDVSFHNNITTWQFWVAAFVMGCISSGTSYALSCIFDDDEMNVNHK